MIISKQSPETSRYESYLQPIPQNDSENKLNWTAKHIPVPARICSNVSGPSLLDGELIIHSQHKELWYLVFDCIGMGGKSISNNVTDQRIQCGIECCKKYNMKYAEYKKNVTDSLIPIKILPTDARITQVTRITNDSLLFINSK